MPAPTPSSPPDAARVHPKRKPYVHVPEPEPWQAAIPEKSPHSPYGYLITGVMVVVAALALWLLSASRNYTPKKKIQSSQQAAPVPEIAPADQLDVAPALPTSWPPGKYNNLIEEDTP